MSRDVMHVTSDDGRQAVYIEGVLVDEGTSIDWMSVITELGCNTYHAQADNNWITEEGNFPINLHDVVFKE